jgi:phage recombination protein Bet
MNAIVTWQPNQLALIKRTVAKDCNDDEFNQFIHICKTVRLDPLRRQIYAFVFNKDNPKYRQMTVVTAIGGYRAIAERTASYRPDDRAPRYEMGEKDAKTNPLGILRCEVTVYKRAHGEWFPVVGEAFWDEYVPVRDGVMRVSPRRGGGGGRGTVAVPAAVGPGHVRAAAVRGRDEVPDGRSARFDWGALRPGRRRRARLVRSERG